MKTLLEIFDKHHCDKGSLRHRYDRVYEPIFQPLQNENINFLEIGILRGESLSSWLDYFPNASIIGLDIFTRVSVEDIPVLKNERISWYKCDSIKGMTKNLRSTITEKFGLFDVIIDDGLHFHDAQRKTFENFIPYLKDTGVYFIEDVWPFDQMSKLQKRHKWLIKHSKEYSDRQYKELQNSFKSYDVTYHDFRKNYHPDTFIVEIRKRKVSLDISVVGNAKSLFDKADGHLIDSSGIVIRFNGGIIVNPIAQGSKTTILAYSFYRKNLKDFKNVKLWDVRNFKEKQYLQDILKKKPSNGIVVLEYLKNNYMNYHIKIFGFDWKQTPTWYRHIPGVPCQTEHHDYTKEKEYCLKMIKQYKWELF